MKNRNWIVGSTKSWMKGGNESYTNWVDVYLHFMLVVEVIEVNRILDLLMTLDATYCNVHLIYGLAGISLKQNFNQNTTTWNTGQHKMPTFPGLGGRTLDILLHYSTFQKQIVF